MDITVLICTYNNCGRLRETLDALGKCLIDADVRWEVLVVNNNSSDNTEQVVKSFEQSLPLVYVFEGEQGKSAALNRGLASTNGKLIIFADDDIIPCEEWIMAYWHEYISTFSKAFFGGSIQSIFERDAPDPELLEVSPYSVKGLDLGNIKRPLQGGEYFLGSNWACSTNILLELGGFDTSLGLNPARKLVLASEETDMMIRLKSAGYGGIYLPNATIKHFVPETKSTLTHVAERAEAYGYFLALKEKVPTCRSFIGVPYWKYRRCLELQFACFIKKASGRKYYRDYVNLRKLLGEIKGLRKLHQG